MTVTENWLESAAKLQADGRAITEHGRSAASSGATFTVSSARDGRTLADVAATDDVDVDRVVHSAVTAGMSWAAMRPSERKRLLHAWGDRIEGHREELALLLALEVGKPVRAALEVETRSFLQSVRWYAEVADKFTGSHPDTGGSSVALVGREPVGVVAVVLPWNFPLSMVGYDVAPALAAGNAVIVKPSPKAPLAVLRACELALEAGIPEGVLCVTPDDGQAAGAALARHALVDVVSVTGSGAAGRAFMGYISEGSPKRLWPKLGGKSFAAVAADFTNLDRAVDAIAWGAYFNQGAMCTGAARIFAETPIYEEFRELLAERTERLVTGDPLHWPTDVGALVGSDIAAVTTAAVSDALSSGATLLSGTGRPQDLDDLGGIYMQPCLLSDVPAEHAIYQNEIFGPVAAVASCGSVDEVVDLVNVSRVGMAMSIWTGGLRTAFRASKKSKVGTVWVNCFEGDDLSVPFGGLRRSGYGRDKTLAAIDKYTDFKTTWIQLDESSYW